MQRLISGRLGLWWQRSLADWLKFFDYAAVDFGRIPDYVLKDENLVAQLPVSSGPFPAKNPLAKTWKS